MKKLSLIFLALFFSLGAIAENACPAKLTYGHERDSFAYTIDLDNLEIKDFGPDHLATSIAIIRELLRMRGCEPTDINFKQTPVGRTALSRCREIVPNVPTSRVCYVESSIGFFNLSWDMLTSVHVIYNRWD